jgi:hypothetical protein
MAEAKARGRRTKATSRGAGATSRRAGTTSRRSSKPLGAEKEQPSAAEATKQVCPVPFCPIGLAFTVMRTAKPDVVDHLVAAGRELLLAARAVVDARTDDVNEGEEPAKLERIEIG